MAAYLTSAEVLPFLHGCCGTFELEGCAGFSRFSKEELAYYSARSDMDFVRSHTPAGIWLECVTDAPEIPFTYRLYRKKWLYVIGSGFEIWENDLFGAGYLIDPQITDSVTISYPRRSSGAARIRIHFTGGSVILPERFCPGNAVPTAQKSRSILFYGDSITQSAYIPTPSLSWTNLLAGWLNAEHINRGIGSMIFEAPSLPAEPNCTPDLLFIEYGCNDIAQNPDNDTALMLADAWLTRICSLFPLTGKYCILPDFVPREGVNEDFMARLPHYCAALSDLCTARGIHAISGRSLIPEMPTLYCKDHIHFNEAGSAVFAGNLLHSIRQNCGFQLQQA